MCLCARLIRLDYSTKTVLASRVLDLADLSIYISDGVSSPTIVFCINSFPPFEVGIPIGNVVIVLIITMALKQQLPR